jgi:hypothetical protein
MRSTKGEEKELKQLLGGKKKNNLPLNYKLATLYFDRRMLVAADTHLKHCKELSQTLVELEANRRSADMAAKTSRECDSRLGSRRSSLVDSGVLPYDELTHRKAIDRVGGIMDDIGHVRDLQEIFCTLTEEVRILPCLLSRFSDNVTDCEAWWTEVRTSPKLSW